MITNGYREQAERYLNTEEGVLGLLQPTPVRAILRWQDGRYCGHLQRIVPDYSRNIVLVTRTTERMDDGFFDELSKLDPDRPLFEVDVTVDLNQRHQYLRIDRRNTLKELRSRQKRHLERRGVDLYTVSTV